MIEENTILFINKDDSDVVKILLELGCYYNIITIDNLKNCIDNIKLYNPDIIIIDEDDFEEQEILNIIKEIKNNDISIVIIGEDKNNEEIMLKAGVNDFILKPYKLPIFRLRIDTQIKIINYIKEIERISFIDELTSLPNRHSFDVYTNKLFNNKDNNRDIGFAIFYIDYFKKFNDTFGHQVGDIVLKKVSRCVSNYIKRINGFVSRWGGEEFIIIFNNLTKDEIINHCENIRKLIESLNINYNTQTLNVTISIGCYFGNIGEISKEKFLKLSDLLLYKAKESGRNKMEIN